MLESLLQAGSYLFWVVLGPVQLAVGLCSAIPPDSFLCQKSVSHLKLFTLYKKIYQVLLGVWFRAAAGAAPRHVHGAGGQHGQNGADHHRRQDGAHDGVAATRRRLLLGAAAVDGARGAARHRHRLGRL